VNKDWNRKKKTKSNHRPGGRVRVIEVKKYINHFRNIICKFIV